MGTPRAQIMNAAGRGSAEFLVRPAGRRDAIGAVYAGRLAKRGNDLIPSKSTEFSE